MMNHFDHLRHLKEYTRMSTRIFSCSTSDCRLGIMRNKEMKHESIM
jgi:hypothetical protein